MKNIEILFTEEEIQKRIKELAKKISNDYKDKEINLICTLKGAIYFTCDLSKNIDKTVKIDFLKVKSYLGKNSGVVELKSDLLPDIKGKDIIIVEDIIDTGKTLSFLKEYLEEKKPKSIKICTLLDKPSRRVVELKADYVGFEIEDEFVIGYGLDFDEEYRNLKYIGNLKDN